ncbi:MULTISPECIES: hypothetical protein [Bacillus]|uniref:Uncharacterized protein n=1 Tax=Bacillus glycinifermentans TaxID=1664069 RepID=A0ABU6HAJ7_9BACI|nr:MULTISPECIES: hypothetical protein [Bacillus]MDU0069654.1 hypothetical protein [Bacillus sp. IG6]MEC0487660.1 hypothetical protein [Bacillus glycinifermentans]MEC0495738.1 hypothetical protein [Bacillus glycinifermentans]MEC0542782.1 hypothetical protein [Bacillus glycinifermentans]MED8017367.1 hypothetical protein [Bacillus glycinifermentans]
MYNDLIQAAQAKAAGGLIDIQFGIAELRFQQRLSNGIGCNHAG